MKTEFKQRHLETLQTLAGERSETEDARRKQAVRVDDMKGILTLAKNLQSATVSAAPTAAEHNALIADVHMLFERLTQISEDIGAKIQ